MILEFIISFIKTNNKEKIHEFNFNAAKNKFFYFKFKCHLSKKNSR
jgi:hypothetical protein